MKKKKIELNKKLVLGKEKVSTLGAHAWGGGTDGTLCQSANPTGACVLCDYTMQPACFYNPLTEPVNQCGFAMSLQASACNFTCNDACHDLQSRMGKC